MKCFCLLLAMTISAALCGCGGDSDPSGNSDDQDAHPLPVSAEPREEQAAEERTGTTEAPPAGDSDSDTSDLKSLTADQLSVEYHRLGSRFQEALQTENSNKALETAEQIASVQREIVSRVERALPDKNEALSAAWDNLGSLLAWMADQYRARDDLSSELKLRHEIVLLLTKLFGQDHWQVTDARRTAGHVQLLQRLTPQQRATLREAVRLGTQSGQLFGEGKHRETLPLAKKVVEVFRTILGEKHQHYWASLQNLAELYRMMGEYARAEPLFRQALAIQKNVLGDKHPDYATNLNNLAALYHSMGEYAQAEPLFRQAMEIRKAVLGEQHPNYSDSLISLALLYRSIGKYTEAESLYRQALEIVKGVHGEQHPDYATSLDGLATLYSLMSEYAQAEPLCQQALEIRKAVLGEKHLEYASSLQNLAALYNLMDEYAQAEPLYRQALEIRKSALGEKHPDYARSLNNLAGLYASAERWSDVTNQFDLARRVLRRHVDRVLPGLTARDQRRFLQRNESPYFYGALSSALAGRQDSELRTFSAAWLVNGKGLALAAQAERQLVARGSDDPQVKKTADELQSVRSRLARLTLNLPNPDRIAAYRQQLDELTQREAELAKELGQAGLGRVREEPWVELDEVRNALPAGSVLIELAKFNVYNFKAKGKDERWQAPHYAAWIIPAVGQGDVQLVDLGAAQPIDEAIGRFRQSMRSSGEQIFDFGEQDATTDCRQHLQAIGKLVLAPLEKHIGQSKRWLISPDGALWLVPWEALSLADGRYAIEEHRISYLVSGRDLVLPSAAELAQKLKHKSPSLIIADPDFEQAANADDLAPGENLAAQERSLPRSLPKGIPSEWSRLFGTKREAEAVEPKLQAYLGQDSDLYQREKATERIFKDLKRPRVVVLSTHGFFLPDQQIPLPKQRGLSNNSLSPVIQIENPLLRCGLILAGANRRPDQAESNQDDGILTGLEIVGTDLRGTELVVLSACDTAVGDVQNGEGVAGLRQALQLAGAGTVVSSLWKVPDKQTTELMTAFWENLANGNSKLDALRNAQLSLIQSHRKTAGAAHPYFWAAFTVTGEAGKRAAE